MKYEQDERTSIHDFYIKSNLLGVDHTVLQLEGLNEVGVPDHAAVGHLQVLHVLPQGVHLLNTCTIKYLSCMHAIFHIFLKTILSRQYKGVGNLFSMTSLGCKGHLGPHERDIFYIKWPLTYYFLVKNKQLKLSLQTHFVH